MYKSFRVKNFRCFKDLQINDLGRVNLIAGKNNTGKTALLEAMYLLTRPLSPTALFDLERTRGLDIAKKVHRDYWNRFHFDLNLANAIELSCSESPSDGPVVPPTRKRKVTIVEREMNENNTELYSAVRVIMGQLGVPPIEINEIIARIDAVLEFSHGGNTKENNTTLRLFYHPELPVPRIGENAGKSFFIPVQGRPSHNSTVDNFSKLEINEQVEDLVARLSTLEPDLRDLRLLRQYGDWLLWAKLQDRRMPLGHLGEGINRFCNLLITLMLQPDGILFIDEIENGIHHSVQKNVWTTIGQAACRENVQVFATTHSLEMIRAAYEAFSEEGKLDEFRYHRLERSRITGEIRATTYNELDLEAVAAFDFDNEVR